MGKGSMLGHSREKNPGRVPSRASFLFAVISMGLCAKGGARDRSPRLLRQGGRGILNRRRMKSPLKAAAVSRTEPAPVWTGQVPQWLEENGEYTLVIPYVRCFVNVIEYV